MFFIYFKIYLWSSFLNKYIYLCSLYLLKYIYGNHSFINIYLCSLYLPKYILGYHSFINIFFVFISSKIYLSSLTYFVMYQKKNFLPFISSKIKFFGSNELQNIFWIFKKVSITNVFVN